MQAFDILNTILSPFLDGFTFWGCFLEVLCLVGWFGLVCLKALYPSGLILPIS